MDFDIVRQYIGKGYISVRKHPSADLYIYNYTSIAVYDDFWPVEVMACRGLIVDDKDNIIARPFKKFFNYEDYLSHRELPEGIDFQNPFEAFEKMDGSLGVLYFIGNKPFIATRGSFDSEQAQRANKILQNVYRDVVFDKNLTYLFEIIYPENRIVIDYKGEEGLFLLAIIDTQTGNDLEIKDIGFPICDKFPLDSISEAKAFPQDNREGFVIKFENGFRVKIKFDEYKRLHKVLCCLSHKSIWECLKTDTAIPLDGVPDEFYDWVKEISGKLEDDYLTVVRQCKVDFKDLGDRKSNAQYYKTCRYPHILFSMLDSKDYSQAIWKLIKPKRSVVFRKDEG